MDRGFASTTEWHEHYRNAQRRRREAGGDIVRKFIKRRKTRRRTLFVTWGACMVGLMLAFFLISGP